MDASATTKGSGAVTGKIAADFQSFAGSKENSTALVTGLRNGSEDHAQRRPASHRRRSLRRPSRWATATSRPRSSLAKYQLAQQGITNPTPEQLKTALNGGTITYNGKTVEYQGVLQMRADGMGWGQIAQQLRDQARTGRERHEGTERAHRNAACRQACDRIEYLTGATTATGAERGGRRRLTTDRGASGGKGIVTASGSSTAGGAAKGKGADSVTNAGQGASVAARSGHRDRCGHGRIPVAHGAGQGKRGVVTAREYRPARPRAGGRATATGRPSGTPSKG